MSITRSGASAALLAFIAALFVFSVSQAPGDGERGYIVVLEDSVAHPRNVAERHAENRGAKLSQVYRTALKGYAAMITPSQADLIARDRAVDYIEFDRPGEVAVQSTPTGIGRVFASVNDALDIDEVDDVRVDADVAILDTGVAAHKDLVIEERTDCSNGAAKAAECVNKSGNDKHGHGTHVAGTAGGLDNGIGVVGIAPGVDIWSVKVLDDEGFGTLSEYIAGIDWVTSKAEDIEVANASLRFKKTEYTEKESQALTEALATSVNAGIVHVVAAGNDKGDVATNAYVPANQADAITVSALADFDGKPGAKATPLWWWNCKTTQIEKGEEQFADDSLAGFSNYGAPVDIAAPGVCINSTFINEEYKVLSGTSMAAPYVSGAAAILASQSNPNSREDVEAIRKTILDSANEEWTDTSADGEPEPLLDVGLGWRIAGKSLAELKLEKESVTVGGGPVGFESEIGGTPFAFECETAKGTGAIERHGTVAATIELSKNCELDIFPVCEIAEPVVIKSKASMINGETKKYAWVEPAEAGKPFTTVLIEGEECPLAELEFEVTGTSAAETKLVLEELVEQPVKFSAAISEAAGAELEFGEEPGYLFGTGTLALSGANKGKKFGIDWTFWPG